MDKLQLAGQNLGRVFNFGSGHLHATAFLVLSVKLPNLQLKARPKQLLGSLPSVIVPPVGSLLNTPWSVKPAPKMYLINSQFDELLCYFKNISWW